MQLARNAFLSLPCRPLASACLEHSIDSGLRAFVVVVAFGAAFAAAGGVAAGGVAWANADVAMPSNAAKPAAIPPRHGPGNGGPAAPFAKGGHVQVPRGSGIAQRGKAFRGIY